MTQSLARKTSDLESCFDLSYPETDLGSKFPILANNKNPHSITAHIET